MGQPMTMGSNALKQVKDEKLLEFIRENKEIMEKYPQLQPCGENGHYFLKYTIYNVENLIDELKSIGFAKEMGGNKEMAIFNIKKYGYEAEIEYVLNALGFFYKSNRKFKANKNVKKQAELFSLLYEVDKECYIRLRNKSTEEFRTYEVKILKDPYRLQSILNSHYFTNNVDMMYSLNCFNNMYSVAESSLFSLQNIAIDIDFDMDKYTLKQALNLVKEEMKGNIPVATVIEAGRRIRLIYTLEDVPYTKKSLNVYNKVANNIAEKINHLGATAQPATTYARIEGSINSKNNSIISSIIFNPKVYKLRDLQNALLPPWERKIKKANRKVFYMPNAYQLNLDRLADLEEIQKIRPDDKELLCYLYRNYCLLANMTQEEAWEKTLTFNNKFPKPKRPNKLDGETKTLNRKQYLHKSETILKLFDITLEEEELIHLKTIISKHEAARRDRVYQKNKYHKELKAEGKVSKAAELRETRKKIKDLKNKGLKNKEIAQELSLTVKTLERHITYMRKNGLL